MSLYYFKKLFLFASVFFIVSDSWALINATEIDTNFPVVRINFKNGSHICSGVFIDRNTILTAAHCVSKKKVWKGFSVEVESITDLNEERVDVKWVKSIPHPKFEYRWYGNHNDIGIIKTTDVGYRGDFPKLVSSNDKPSEHIILYGCGRISLSSKTRKCLKGDNTYSLFLNQILTWGESVNRKKRGYDVSVAPNDSGGPVIDKNTEKVIGVQWGTWVTSLYKYKLQAPSFITSLFDKDNLEFVLNNLEQTKLLNK